MIRILFWGVPVVLWSLMIGAAYAAPPSESDMARRVDQLLAERWEEHGLTPAPLADDAEFLRRAWLDLTGSIPPVNEGRDTDGDGTIDEYFGVRGFLMDPRADKRQRLIDYLLTKPTHAGHLANLWKNTLLPAEANVLRFGGDGFFETWLRNHFVDNTPYDRVVRELLLATGTSNQIGPVLFYTALELKPEELAASTSRVFLGTQIQCAQCHNHPFDHWTREDFWGYAAFFARLQRPAMNQFAAQVAEAATGEVQIPDTTTIVPPQFLGGPLSPDDTLTRRERLADWLASANNPFFARATVNRLWAMLFGCGLVDPVDDLGEHNPPSHPQVLDELAGYFAESGFDLRRLIRTLAATEAYQRTSRTSVGENDRPDLFTHMAIKTLSAEQLYDCLNEAMGGSSVGAAGGQAAQVFPGGFDQNRQAFLARFRAPTQGATEYQAGIPQALSLMNGALIGQATDIAQSNRLIALQAPYLSDSQRVEWLFLSTLGRPPDDNERTQFVEFVQSRESVAERRQALSDVFWALLNSAEFVLNH